MSSAVASVGADVFSASSVRSTVIVSPLVNGASSSTVKSPFASTVPVPMVLPASSLTVTVVPGSPLPVTSVPSGLITTFVGASGAVVSTSLPELLLDDPPLLVAPARIPPTTPIPPNHVHKARP